jgi:hypothetical protein
VAKTGAGIDQLYTSTKIKKRINKGQETLMKKSWPSKVPETTSGIAQPFYGLFRIFVRESWFFKKDDFLIA